MALKSFSERRLAFRGVLERPALTNAASLFDGASARLAKAAGVEVGIFPGSLASHAVLSAPDIVALTLTEFADQARRISRASDLPFLVDADHGYGNAVNVRRTVEELETSGVAGLTIEDTYLPRRYGSKGVEFISQEELRDKLRAALDARVDPNLVIIGRTAALANLGLDETVARVSLLSKAGVDAIFVTGVTKIEDIEALHSVTNLPLIYGNSPFDADKVVPLGVRIRVLPHLPYFVMLRALYDSYTFITSGGEAGLLSKDALSAELQAVVLDQGEYSRIAKEYMG